MKTYGISKDYTIKTDQRKPGDEMVAIMEADR